jgi:hypothetical protein
MSAILGSARKRGWHAVAGDPRHLVPDDSWRTDYYENTERARQRMLFAGTLGD